MSRAAQINAGGWDRRRLLLALAVVVLATVLLVAGLGYAIYYAVGSATASPTKAAPSARPVGVDGPTHGEAHRDAVAAQPMLVVTPDDARQGIPAAIAGPTIQIPAATKTGPAQVGAGFPKTPQGAIGQLAAIETSVLQGMSIPAAGEVYTQWAMPGGVGIAQWQLTKNVQAFLASTDMGQSKDPTVAVTATPVAAQVKGTDGDDWVLACVLLDVRALITTNARIGYGYCERMQWVGGTGGRWMIAPGTPPAPAPSTWPGTDLSVTAGWRTWAELNGAD